MTIAEHEEHQRLLAALRKIRDTQGRVCDGYENCQHRACQSSYAAWQIAVLALKGIDS